MINNMPQLKMGIVSVSRDCFPMTLSATRRQRVVEAYNAKYETQTGKIYECPTCVENETHMRTALAQLKEAGCNALVVYLGNFGPETPETLLAKEFGGPVMFVAAAEETGSNLVQGRGDAYCGMLNASYNLKLRNIRAYIPEYPVGTADECADMIAEFAPLARAVIGLNSLKIISFGPRPQDFIACNAPIKQLYNLGVEIEENSELDLFESFKKRLDDKVNKLFSGEYNLGSFSEFGLRRRLSAEAQELAIQKLSSVKYPASAFVGTSNVYLAKKFNLTPVGTMAHEWIMCVGQGNHKHNPAYSNWYALDAWVREYGVLNGIALTDAITTDCFLKDFQLTYATLFSGVRHDSGDPYEWGDKMIEHYKSLGIDHRGKTLLFSDSLDFERADKLNSYFKDRAKVAFGIGTYIANDTDVPALNIVMKTTACNGMDVAKISDTTGKGMCKNPEYINYLQRCIDWRMQYGR